MNRISLKIGMAVLLLVALCWHNAAAIGAWVGGKSDPGSLAGQGYLYISIDSAQIYGDARGEGEFVYTAKR